MKIGNREIQLLEPTPNYDTLPSGQADAYRLLLALEDGQYSEETLIRQLGLKSCLPLWSRIEHLAERGMVHLQDIKAA
jgi:hypothetical protein